MPLGWWTGFSRIIAAIFLMVFWLQSASADDIQSLVVGGVTRTYLVHVPPGIKGPAPLLLAFHGAGGSPEKFARSTGFDALSDQAGVIVVYPAGIQHRWNDGRIPYSGAADDLGFVASLIGRLEHTYPIDQDRIYAAGMSNGATFSEAVACKMPETLAAIAAVAGTLPQAIMTGCTGAVSALQINGTNDPVMPYGGGELRAPGLPGGDVTSVDQTLAVWARLDGCAGFSAPLALSPKNISDPTRVTYRQAENCRAGFSVTAYAINGGGHQWPGAPNPQASRQLNASMTVMAFLLSQHR